jgi:hypothetical protein
MLHGAAPAAAASSSLPSCAGHSIPLFSAKNRQLRAWG